MTQQYAKIMLSKKWCCSGGIGEMGSWLCRHWRSGELVAQGFERWGVRFTGLAGCGVGVELVAHN